VSWLLASGLSLLAACGGESTGPSLATLTIATAAVPNAVLGTAYSHQLQASGGQQPYTWTITAGSLPPGLDLDTATGLLSGTPPALVDNDFTVQVSSADGQTATKALGIGVFTMLAVSTAALPSGIQNTPYDATLAATGGDGAYAWTVAAGTLPSGLALASGTGALSGTPTATGSPTLTFRVSSGDGQSAEVQLELDIYGALTISTASLLPAVEDVAYADTLAVEGGDGSYTWSISAGGLPSGLVLDPATGVISGTPTSVESSMLTLAVESGDGQTADVDLAIGVFSALVISTSSLAPGLQDAAYADTLQAVGGDGTYTWSLEAGSLPTGLGLDPASGVIAGTPTVLATPTLTLRVQSGDGQTAQVDLTLGVFGVLAISSPSLSSAVEGAAYAEAVEVTGGDGTGTWSITAGTLPDGLALDPSSGSISGTPTTIETQSFTVEVQSGDGQTAQADLSISVYPLLQLTTSSLAVATQAIAYEDTLEASGGDGSYAWSIASGSLPGGFGLDPSTGRVSGTSSVLQAANVTFQVASGDGQAAQASLSLTVEPYVLSPAESCSDHPPESIVTFEDDKLTVAVRVALLVPVGVGLTCERADDLGWFPASNDTIASLAGIQNLTGLTYLWLDSNSINDLTPLQELTGLQRLVLDRNDVTDISPLAGLTNLDFLGLGENSISDVTPLAGLTSLTNLNLQANSISDVSALAGLTSLDRLFLGENSVTDVSPLAGLTALTILNLYDNGISDITSLAGLTALTYFGLGRDTISDLSPSAGFTSLETLALDLMGITDIGFVSGLTSLSVLGLAYNEITDLGPLSGLTQLTQLGLYDNAITDISALSGLTSLAELFLGRNTISDVTALGGLTALTRLDLRVNSITDISALEGLTQLWEVLLEYNAGLSDIQPLLDNTGMGPGDYVWLNGTSVSCTDANTLAALGVTVYAACP